MHEERHDGPPRRNAFDALAQALQELENRYECAGRATVGDILEPLGDRAGGLGAALFALPFLGPISLGPLTTVASVVIALIGIGLLSDREESPIPRRIRSMTVPRAAYRALRGALHRLPEWMRRGHHASPRWLQGSRGRLVCGVGMIVAAALLAVPIPFMPLTNSLPALSIIGFSLGWANQDGRLARFGVSMLLASVALFVALGVAVSTIGFAAVRAAVSF
ncbi:MAG: exopolysaccharide biosynthesis protein [Acidobacteria bacterium]|nr:exopolysaccharide biosynthesis protein [Acidobacteriota bacterium]